MPRFMTTHWSLILDGRQQPQQAQEALVEICERYRQPVFGYLRQHGYGADDAEDLTQEFFTRLVQQRWDARADPSRGRFRTFLLTALQRFLSNELAQRKTSKRGGALQRVDIDDAQLEAPSEQSPEQAFNRAWVMTLMAQAVARLEQEARAAGREALYRQLEPYLIEPPDDADYASLAASLGMRTNTIAVHVHRLRRRLRELMREELLQTVSSADEVETEMSALREIVGADHLH